MGKLDINGYNTSFKAFTDFAQSEFDAGREKTVVRANDPSNCIGRSITAASTDKVHKWFRSTDDKNANNYTRELFKAAICDMFGSEARIPASVKKAMLMVDYNCGKPLTAKRIIAVKNAIDADGTAKGRAADQALERCENKKDQNKATMTYGILHCVGSIEKICRTANLYAKVKNCTVSQALDEVAKVDSSAYRLMLAGGRLLANTEAFTKGLRIMDAFEAHRVARKENVKEEKLDAYKIAINTVLSVAGDDEILFDLLADDRVFNKIIIDPLVLPRPEMFVKQRMKALKANVDELRTAAKGNERLFKAGVAGLKSFGGNAFDKRMLTKIVNAVAKADVKWTKNLKTNARPIDIHRAIMGFQTMFDKLAKEQRLFAAIGDMGVDAKDSLRNLVLKLVFARVDEAKLENFSNAIHSEAASKLVSTYDNISKRNVFRNDSDRTSPEFSNVTETAKISSSLLKMFATCLDEERGVEANVLNGFHDDYTDERAIDIINDCEAFYEASQDE